MGPVLADDSAYDRAAQAVGSSAVQACSLDQLTSGCRSMGELAVAPLCDSSNVTQLVTRLTDPERVQSSRLLAKMSASAVSAPT